MRYPRNYIYKIGACSLVLLLTVGSAYAQNVQIDVPVAVPPVVLPLTPAPPAADIPATPLDPATQPAPVETPPVAEPAPQAPFNDVALQSYYQLPLSYLKEKEMISGYPDGSFKPLQEINRAEALAMILAATRKDLTIQKKDTEATAQTEKPIFKDVIAINGYSHLVTNAKNAEIISGVDKGEKKGIYFYPDRTLIMPEALRMIFRADPVSVDTLTASANQELPKNISPALWFAEDVRLAVHLGVIAQTSSGELTEPADTPLTRGELAEILYRYLRVEDGSSFGRASWYGDGLAKTRLDKNQDYREKSLTAAHLTLPFGTLVRVTNIRNGKEVTVVINDRGPYVKGRIIDVSYTAFSQIASPADGIATVQIDIISP